MHSAMFLALLMVAATATAEERPKQIDPDDVIFTEDPAAVTKCTSAGEVSSRSGLGAIVGGDVAAEMGAAKVRSALARRAAELGATVVVVEKVSSMITTAAKGTAYRCSDEVVLDLRSSRVQRRRRSEKNMVMPERAIEIGSGFIGMQAGVANRPGQRVPFRAPPTQYFLAVRNVTDAPLYVAGKLVIDGKTLQEQLTVFPGKLKSMTWMTNGIVADKDIPLDISFYEDEGRTKLLKTEKTALFFARALAEKLLSVPYDGPVVSIIGWKEGLTDGTGVTGTSANEETRYDVVWSLSREESKAHRDCKHDIVGVEPQTIDPAQLTAMFPGTKAEPLKSVEEHARLERWRVRSCDKVTAYQVLLVPGTDGTTYHFIQRAAAEP